MVRRLHIFLALGQETDGEESGDDGQGEIAVAEVARPGWKCYSFTNQSPIHFAKEIRGDATTLLL